MMEASTKHVVVRLGDLTIHPASIEIFGEPREAREFKEIRASIEKDGLLDPLLVTPQKRVVSGALRLACLLDIHGPDHEVAAQEREFSNPSDELVHLIKTNLMRREWSRRSKAIAFRALRLAAPEHGGTRQPRGRPRKDSDRGIYSPRVKSDEAAAELLGLGKHEARALDTVFSTEGVPQSLQDAVEAGDISPTRAGNAVRRALLEQGGRIADPQAVNRYVAQSRSSRPPPPVEKMVEPESAQPAGSKQKSKPTAEHRAAELLRAWRVVRKQWPLVPSEVVLRRLEGALNHAASDSVASRGLAAALERLTAAIELLGLPEQLTDTAGAAPDDEYARARVELGHALNGHFELSEEFTARVRLLKGSRRCG